MSKLGLLDQAFHSLETNGLTPIIMGGAMIFDPSSSPYPLDGKILAEHLAARLERIPIMRKKLLQDRFKIGNLRLVEDPDFDVSNHISVVSLPAPGGYDELTACLESFSAQRLDMSRPLWHYEIIENLEGGKIAVATHIHHVILDGVGAVKALASLWDLQPLAPEKPVGRHWKVDAIPTPLELLRDAIRENAERLYVKTPNFLLKNAGPLAKNAAKLIKSRLQIAEQKGEAGKRALPEVRRTSLNTPRLSPKRSVSYVEFSLAEVKKVSKDIDCSINDLMLLLSSCALEHYFEKIGEELDFDLVAAMPINLRAEDSTEAAGNVLTLARVNLHNTMQALPQRVGAICAQTRAVKSTTKPAKKTSKGKRGIDQMELLGLFSPIVVEGLFYAAVKFNLLEKKAFLNVAITNVPGSPVPIYLAGAKIVSTVPMAPPIDTIGMTICISSMGDLLSMGFHGCGEAIKDKHALTEGASKGFDELKKALAKQGESSNAAASGNKPRGSKATSNASSGEQNSARATVDKTGSRRNKAPSRKAPTSTRSRVKREK
jgi:diacylglycerol O-acyltransferase / wax synthase